MSWGAAIGAVGSIINAVGSNGPNRRERVRASQEAITHDSLAFKQRIADLRAMGISPLMAAGSSYQASSPQIVGGQDYSGVERGLSAAGQAIDNYQTNRKSEAHNAVLREASVAEAESRIRLNDSQTALAQLQLSQQAVAAANRRASPSAPTTTPAQQFDAVKNVPSEITSRQGAATHVTAGSNPAFAEVEVRPGRKALVPQTTEGFHENMESMINPFYIIATLKANRDRYGADAAIKNVQALSGLPRWVIAPFVMESPLSESAQEKLGNAIDRAAVLYGKAKRRERVSPGYHGSRR